MCRSLCAVVFVASVFTACDTEDPITTPEGDKTKLAKPTLSSSDITATGFVVNWAKIENASVYAYSISDGSNADMAAEEELQYTPNLKMAFSQLTPEVTYTIRVKAVPQSDNATYTDSDFAEIKVTTTTATPEPEANFTFREISITPASMEIEITPTDANAIYIQTNASKNAIETSESIEAFLLKYIAESCFWITDWTLPDDFSLFQGPSTYMDGMNIYPERDYVLIAATVNTKAEIVNYSTHAYHTPAVTPIDCTFDIKVDSITYNSMVYSVIPTDKYASYVFEIVEKVKFAGKTDAEIIALMMENASTFYSTGDQINQGQSYLTDNTEYGIYIVGCIQQQPTTGLFKKEFKTLELIFTFDSKAYTEAAILSVTKQESGFAQVEAQLTPNDATFRYQAVCGAASEFAGKSDVELAKLVEKLGESSEWHKANLWTFDYSPSQAPIPSDDDCMIIILSKDTDSRFGKLNKFTFRSEPTAKQAATKKR